VRDDRELEALRVDPDTGSRRAAGFGHLDRQGSRERGRALVAAGKRRRARKAGW
jgi:hypothetical protein